jgi:hypothetical protein
MSEYDHGGLHLAAYEGDIHVLLDEDREQRAGHARLFVLNADAAEQEGKSLFNLLDMRPETSAFIPLLGDEDGELASAVLEVLGERATSSRNMLLLDRVEILPAFRGQELGIKYLRAAISRFGLGCRLAAACPFPLQLGRHARTLAKSAMPTLRAARAKLRKHFAQAGFVPLPRSDLMILDLEKHRDGQ